VLHDAETFIDRYRLQPNIGPLYELIADGRTAGWLYGAVHYGTVENPSLSQAATRAMAQTRHVYLEQTDLAGSTWPMHDVIAPDLEWAVRAKRRAARASADRVRQGIAAAKKLEWESGGVAPVLANDRSYYKNWALAYNYCGAFYEYGTERLARAFASGKNMTIHSLETEGSRASALETAREERCQSNQAGRPAPSPVRLAEEQMEGICRIILAEIARDQRDGRPASLTTAAACVLDSRHRTMAAGIVKAAQAGEKPFVVVGRGHLMPDQNLIALLEEQGLALRRVD
jgi:hypothetical protein